MNDDATSAAAPRRRSRLPGFTFCMALAPLLVVQLGLLWLIQDDAGVTLPDLADDLVRKRLAAAGIRCDWSRARIAFSGRVELTDARVGGGVDDPVFAAKRLVAVEDTRTIGKASMIHNGATPKIDIDPETYHVKADGELLVCEPAKELPMAQRYFLF